MLFAVSLVCGWWRCARASITGGPVEQQTVRVLGAKSKLVQ